MLSGTPRLGSGACISCDQAISFPHVRTLVLEHRGATPIWDSRSGSHHGCVGRAQEGTHTFAAPLDPVLHQPSPHITEVASHSHNSDCGALLPSPTPAWKLSSRKWRETGGWQRRPSCGSKDRSLLQSMGSGAGEGGKARSLVPIPACALHPWPDTAFVPCRPDLSTPLRGPQASLSPRLHDAAGLERFVNHKCSQGCSLTWETLSWEKSIQLYSPTAQSPHPGQASPGCGYYGVLKGGATPDRSPGELCCPNNGHQPSVTHGV